GGTCASAGRPAARTVRLREVGALTAVLTVPPSPEPAGEVTGAEGQRKPRRVRGVVLRHAEHPWWARAWSRGPRCPLSEAMLPRGRLFQLYPRCLRHRSWARCRASGRSPVRVSGRPTTCRSQCSLTETVVAVSAPATPWCH